MCCRDSPRVLTFCWLITTLAAASCSELAPQKQAETRHSSAVANPAPKSVELRVGDFNYAGAFRVPTGTIGASSFSFGGTALAFNPTRSSLFIVGHDHHQAIAEIEIPRVVNSDRLGDLKTAKVIQPFTDVKSKIPNWTLEGNTKIGGLLVVDHQLIGTIYEYYDAEGGAVDSHFKLSSLNLASATATGLFQVGNMGAGYVGGYMTTVPSQWQDDFGAFYLTGLSGVAIIARTSAGPGVFGFNPAHLGATTAPTTPLIYYPYSHGGSHPDDHLLADPSTQNPLFNTTSEVRGVVFPEGTDSVLFFGRHGTGPFTYIPGVGPDAAPYVHQVWAYDAKDLAAVKNGVKRPWEVRPAKVSAFELPFQVAARHIGGVAYDARTGRLYLSQQHADQVGYDLNPVIHVFELSRPADPRDERPGSAEH